jgi:hypothetical protein
VDRVRRVRRLRRRGCRSILQDGPVVVEAGARVYGNVDCVKSRILVPAAGSGTQITARSCGSARPEGSAVRGPDDMGGHQRSVAQGDGRSTINLDHDEGEYVIDTTGFTKEVVWCSSHATRHAVTIRRRPSCPGRSRGVASGPGPAARGGGGTGPASDIVSQQHDPRCPRRDRRLSARR